MIFQSLHVADDVFLGPGVIFTNDSVSARTQSATGAKLRTTTIRRGATVGEGAVVMCGVTIGEHAFIGAGTVVTSDAPAHNFVSATQVG
jgi:UDP-2-acetamido-3-amino-2,3-dideoxy-glucuronate N-acetyltransferase